jgi:nitroimidazol reductase NimA-like FMN-containing flavoprotein (pyridoxamine 5'-phosphate oxidase superfamily)
METISQQQAGCVAEILDAGRELVLASIRPDGAPHASTTNYASDGLRIYCTISLDSQKAHNIRHDSHVAYVVNAPYRSWAEIRGVSIEGEASMLDDPVEQRLASTLLLRKYPEFSAIIANTATLPWPGMLFIALQPARIALLDYTQGFGHTEYFTAGIERPPG